MANVTLRSRRVCWTHCKEKKKEQRKAKASHRVCVFIFRSLSLSLCVCMSYITEATLDTHGRHRMAFVYSACSCAHVSPPSHSSSFACALVPSLPLSLSLSLSWPHKYGSDGPSRSV